jgi:ADP-heptose:LPS heptosyltransferase
MKRILFCTGEGIGNVIQTIPVVRTLKEVLGYEVDFWHAFGFYRLPNLIPYIDNWFVGRDILKINPAFYKGKVSTFWTRNHLNVLVVNQLKLLNEIKPLIMDRSEVDTYMDIARDLGVREEDILWHGGCNYLESRDNYDIVIHNGYKKEDDLWKIKEYPHHETVAKMLIDKGLSICSIGSKNEYVEGTVNKTELTLLSSLGVIKNCKVFLSNDSGLYHCANALSVPNVVIFTATSIEKNYDSRFHRYATIVGRDDLECRPCQKGRRWTKDCKTWDCQQVAPEVVYKAVMEKI